MWKYNPKLYGSGIISCIPQKGRCPNNCKDCFFQSGRSYLEPLSENLPHIPTKGMAKDRIVRMNDGNDSNYQRELVEKVAQRYDNYFFNTSKAIRLEDFTNPVVLTINPAEITDIGYQKIDKIPKNLMFVRIRVNAWNLLLVRDAIYFYSSKGTRIILTFIAYYHKTIPQKYKGWYTFKKRTLNSYWTMKQEKIDIIMNNYRHNTNVFSCGVKGSYRCKDCGNCMREYYNTKERMRGIL